VLPLLLTLDLACAGAPEASSPDDSGEGGAGGAHAKGGAGGHTGGAGGSHTGGAGGHSGGAGGSDAGGAGGHTGGAGGMPDAAGGSDGEVDAGDSDGGSGSVTFTAVQALFAAHCVRCHDPAHPVVPESPTFVKLALTASAAYKTLVNKPANETCGGILVKPGEPDKSYLFHKVNDQMPCDGVRMPHGGMLRPQPLEPEEIQTIADWIRAGAPP
jgi:hypothetical protein